jgi:hypothetical protein
MLVAWVVYKYFALTDFIVPAFETGITGFETASNYVEEMRDSGVFVSTVNGMWCVNVLHFATL